MSSFSSSIEALKKENEMLIIACNNNEQYSRKSNIRIFGLDETNQENCKQKVIGFIHNKLHLKDITSNDIDVAHRVGPISRVKTRPMLVKLHNRDQKMSILTARKQLKHSGLSVAEDLTKKNVELLNRLKNHHRIESTWSWNNKLYAKGINGAIIRISLFCNVDTLLDVANVGN